MASFRTIIRIADNFDDEPAAHAVAAVKHGSKDLERPSERPSALFLSYPAILDSTLPARVSNEGLARAAMLKEYAQRDGATTDYCALEFYDFQQLTENLLSREESELTWVAKRCGTRSPILTSPAAALEGDGRAGIQVVDLRSADPTKVTE
jgi:hypothetical protein